MTTLMHYEPWIIEEWLKENPRPSYDSEACHQVRFTDLRQAMFIPAFYKAVLLHPTKPPTVEECWSVYLQEYSFLREHPDIYGIQQRFYRNYASFIMELHAYSLFKTAGIFDGVFNDLHLDVMHGIDFVVWKKKPRYIGLQLRYISNFLSEDWGSIKKERNHGRCVLPCPSPIPVSEIIIHDLPLIHKEALYVGRIHLYKQLHIDRIKQVMFGIDYWN